jgi:hypothetical protein
MNNKRNSRDYVLISAYLDNQLAGKDRALFEQRLKADPELQKELSEISSTRLMLRSLPRRKAPRNYFVTAPAAQPHSTLKLAPIFGIVSAAASVLLALVIFGSTFISPTSQVALAPAPSIPEESVAPQQEIARNAAASPVPPTEAAPAVMLGAPIQATPMPILPEQAITQPGNATPTTIYIYVSPPTTPTPENPFSIAEAPTETPSLSCDDYFKLVPLPRSANLTNCPTPTGTLSEYLEKILSTSTGTPTSSPTPTVPITSALTANSLTTKTPSPTETPTPTSTPSPTDTLTPTDTPPPPILQSPPQAQQIIPSGGAKSSTEITAPNQLLGTGGPTQVEQVPAQSPNKPTDYTFLSYLLLTMEISLAVIAVLAGITAIILRIRAR